MTLQRLDSWAGYFGLAVVPAALMVMPVAVWPLLLTAGTVALAWRRRPRSWYRFRTAVHEAGHAVTAIALGVQIQSVTVAGTKDYAGMCAPYRREWQTMSAGERRDWVKSHVIVGFAGYAAELAVCRFPCYRWKSYGDRALAAGHLTAWREGEEFREFTREEADAFWATHPELEARMQTRAESLVRDFAPAVRALAAELLRKETLYGREVSHILRPWFHRELG